MLGVNLLISMANFVIFHLNKSIKTLLRTVLFSVSRNCELIIPMEQHVFTNFLIIEGATDKALQLSLPLKSIYNKNFGFVEQKCTFED